MPVSTAPGFTLIRNYKVLKQTLTKARKKERFTLIRNYKVLKLYH